jgi:hypothetical protein
MVEGNMTQHKTPHILFVLAGILVLISLPALAFDLFNSDTSIRGRDWSVTASRSISAYPPTNAEVEKFINEQLDSNWTMPLCSYKFIDVYDGNYRLVASLDINGRHSCSEVVVVEKTNVHVSVINKFKAIAADNVNDMLSDIDGDNSPELIITQPWTKAETGKCQATWKHVYKWNRDRFSDESTEFNKLYKTRLRELTNSVGRDRDPTCDQMEMDKIARMQGSPRTGFDRAVGWMKDPNGSLRRKAAAVFADIGDDASKKNLALLARDNDPLTAATARMYQESHGP